MSSYIAPFLLAALVLILSLLATYLMWQNAREEAEESLQTDFSFRVRETANSIQQRMATYEQVLRGTQGLFSVSEDLTREEFRSYVSILQLNEYYPGIQGIGISLLVPKEQKDVHIAAIRKEGFPDYAISPPGERDVYSAIVMLEPFSGINLRAFGYDMYSNPVRRAAMEQARDSGKPALSGKVRLIQETGVNLQAGFLMYLPLYQRGLPNMAAKERRDHILGWVYAPFRANDLMAGLGGENAADLDIRIYDGETIAVESLLYDSPNGTAADPMMLAVEPIHLAGRTWTLAVSSLPAYEDRIISDKPRSIALTGIGISVLMALIIWLLASGRARAVALATSMTDELRRNEDRLRRAYDELELKVDERTADLRKSNESLSAEIAERKKIQSDLFSSRERLASIFDAVSEGLIVQSKEGRLIGFNLAAQKILGVSKEQMESASSLSQLIRPIYEDGSPFPHEFQPMQVSLRTGESQRNVVMGVYKLDGLFTWLSLNTVPVFDESGSVSMVVSNFSDITEKKRSEELVWQQANFDALTGLPNRRLFQDHLEQEIRKARRAGQPLALMFLDLDGFKHVNDTLGHDMGDLLLTEAAERLKTCVRESDTVARLGGDEFTVILTEMSNLRHVGSVAQHILHKLSEPFHLGSEIAHVSCSIGITLYPEDASGIEDLLKNADQAMYAAKQEGRNRYHYFTESMQQAALERMWLINELRGAIASKQFSLVYQPIVELESGCINKAEALIRWNHPERGFIDPSIFIPVAEETGMIHDIGDWVFFEAANQAVKWRKMHHPDFQISINKSPVQFRAKYNDLALWFDYLKMLNLPGQSIAVEITEGLLMDASADITDQLLAFRDGGVEVSLDDFGTGYSSLAYLKKFDIDRLKIDQTFIRNLTAHSDDLALCEAIIVMAHKLGIKVVAEGVETKEQRNLLAEAGCDFVQGYFFSGPLSANELDIMLQSGALFCSESLPKTP